LIFLSSATTKFETDMVAEAAEALLVDLVDVLAEFLVDVLVEIFVDALAIDLAESFTVSAFCAATFAWGSGILSGNKA
jgi:hypothetical protein